MWLTSDHNYKKIIVINKKGTRVQWYFTLFTYTHLSLLSWLQQRGMLPQKYCRIFACKLFQFSSVQSLSHVRLFATPWITACQASLSITNFWSLLILMSIKSMMPSSHLILCRPLLFLPPIPPSISAFTNESILHMRWPKYWSFSFSIIIYSTFNIQILRSELIVLIFRSLY